MSALAITFHLCFNDLFEYFKPEINNTFDTWKLGICLVICWLVWLIMVIDIHVDLV